jgi:MFS-type transporter involved in bile tolerance (Atg22 family)
VGSLGPSLLLLADNVGETSDTIGSLFSARGAGWITGRCTIAIKTSIANRSALGSIISGFLYKKFKAHPMMFISLITLVVCSFVTPFVAAFPLLLLVTAVVGL